MRFIIVVFIICKFAFTNGICSSNQSRNINGNDSLNIVKIYDAIYEVKRIDGIGGKIYSLRIDSKGNIYYRDYANVVYVLKSGTNISVPVETSGISFDIALDDDDNVYIANNEGIYHLLERGEDEMIEGAARSVYFDNHSDYLYFGMLSGGIYRISNCILKQLRRLYDTSYSFDNSQIIPAFIAIITETAEKIKGIPDIIVKKLALSSKGDIYYIESTKEDAFVLQNTSSSPIRILLGNRFIYDVKIDSVGNVYFAGILGLFVYRSDGSHSWSATNVNTNIGTIYTVYPSGNDIYLGGDGCAYKLERKT